MTGILDILIDLADRYAMTATIVLVVILFLFFVIRPFFALLFSRERLAARRALKAAEEDMENKDEADEKQEDSSETVISRGEVQEKISKLAESEPERAGDLVKQWLKEGQE